MRQRMPLCLHGTLVTVLTAISPISVTLIAAGCEQVSAEPPTEAPGRPGRVEARAGAGERDDAGARAGAGERDGEVAVRAVLRVAPADTCARRIEGFGTTASTKLGIEPWFQRLYYDDLGASVLRVDMTPHFRAPVNDYAYSSPGFQGAPALPGPDGSNARSYRDIEDYRRSWNQRRAPIAVLTRDIEAEVRRFNYRLVDVQNYGELARAGVRAAALRGEPFKLVGSIWSPAPWLKRSSGNHIEGTSGVLPKAGTPWPFIWAGNFSGGVLDTSDAPLPQLHDGAGPTSALTQFARITASYVLGFQRTFGVRFYALSIQNELNFETFYNSCSYPDARGYLAALKAVRREFDRHPELSEIRLMGPEDLLGNDAYALWQYGSGEQVVHKNLQYLAAAAADPEASAALALFAVHAYANDGVNAAGDDARMWRYWLEGWSAAPAPGLPQRVRGVRAFARPSWMTEMSGEPNRWLPAPHDQLARSALGLALKIHTALTVGEESAWLYWQLSDGKPVGPESLTDPSLRERSAKYVAFKHFARFVRPGACAVSVTVEAAGAREPSIDAVGARNAEAGAGARERNIEAGAGTRRRKVEPRTGARERKSEGRGDLYASAYRNADGATTLVVIHSAQKPATLEVQGLGGGALRAYVSHAGGLWQRAQVPAGASVTLELAPSSVVTLTESSQVD